MGQDVLRCNQSDKISAGRFFRTWMRVELEGAE